MNTDPLVAITGAGGFLGAVLSKEVAMRFRVRLNDFSPPPGLGEPLPGDLCDPDIAADLVRNATALVINHMLPRTADSYVHPARPFDVNVTATAGLFEAASRSGCRRVVLISSTEVVGADLRAGHFLRRDLPPSPCSLYGLTKSLQEQVAAFYHRTAGLEVAILRPAYVTDAATMTDKYGRQKPSVNWQFVDRSDIARAVLSALTLADLRFEVFYVLSHWRATERADLEHTRQRLGWQPSACFDHYPEDP